MNAESFDPRQVVQEPEAPDYYVVTIWSADQTYSEEWKLTEDDVEDVVTWAREKAGTNSFEILAHSCSRYIRLKGTKP